MGNLSAVARGLGSAGARAGQPAAAVPAVSGMSPLAQSYQQWSFGANPALPRDWSTFQSGAFGPLTPIVPVGIDVPPDDAERPMPRRWEYSVGWNMPIGVPGTEGLKLATFATLRSFADLYSVIRACITNATNDILGVTWDIVPTEQAEKAMHGNQKAQDDFAQRREEALKFWSRPDPQYRTWQQWMRALLEDFFVIDAASLYIHPARGRGHGPFGSNMASLDYIDGSTIRPLVDMRGSTPAPPDVAYQQYLWGVPRVDLSTPLLADDEGITAVMVDEFLGDQVMYMPQYTRAWTPYGFSAVERALIPAATGLRRQLHALQFYTEGSIPGLFVTPGPDISTPSQIAQLQRALNNLAGDQAYKHKIIVLPPGSKLDPQKSVNLADQFDQVLAAEITMAFEMTPLDIGVAPRVAAVQSPAASREFSTTNAQNTQKRGLLPRLEYLKDNVFDYVMQRVWRQEDMEWRWTGLETGEDLTEKITVWSQLVRNGIVSIDQAAQEFGIEAWGLPQTAEPLIYTATGAVPVSSIGSAPPAIPGAPAQAALPPGSVQVEGEESADDAPGVTTGNAAKPPAPGSARTPAHHAAQAAENDAPEAHHAAKAMRAELALLERYLRKGRDPQLFVTAVLSPAALKAAAIARPDGVEHAVAAAVAVAKAEDRAKRRADQIARAHRAVAAGLGHLVRTYRSGQRSAPAVIDDGVAVMADGYRTAMHAGSAAAASDLPDTPVIDLAEHATERAEAQRGYLSGLLNDVVGGISLPELSDRLDTYGATLSGAYNAGYGLTVQAAHPQYEIEWQLGAADHCSLCVDRAGKTYTFDTLPGWPGDGGFGGAGAICLGGPNCHCSLIYREGGQALATGENAQRPESVPYYQSQAATIGAARAQAAQARQDFLATIPPDAAARAHTRDSLRQELADAANARTRAAGGYPGVSTEPQDIPAGEVAARIPPGMKGAPAPAIAKAGYDLNRRSGMISLDLAPGTIEPVPDGVDDHHITVIYLGPDVDDEAFARACQTARDVATRTAPLAGTIGGRGEFPAGDDGIPVYAEVDLPGVQGLYDALSRLQSSSAAAAEHGYTPHVTLTYLQPGQKRPAPVPDTAVRFTELSVHRGDDVTRFPLTGGGGNP